MANRQFDAGSSESIGVMLYWALVGALLLGGTYFLAQAISRVINPIYTGTDPGQIGSMLVLTAPVKSADATIAIALFIPALSLIVIRGFRESHNLQIDLYMQQERRIKLEEEQAVYLRYLADQARKNKAETR